MPKIKPNRVPELLASMGTQIAFAVFIKRNGERRRMWFQKKIPESMVSGEGAPYNPTEKRLSFVRDIHITEGNPIRSIRWDAIEKLTINHKKYKVTNNV